MSNTRITKSEADNSQSQSGAIKRVAVSPCEFAEATSLSIPMVRKLIRQGDLRAVRAGARLLIPVAELQRFS